jgi:ribonucleotide monophosphatase NagD (HAD superfamily)
MAGITDAEHAGVGTILVPTGATAEADLSHHAVQPDLVFPSLAALGAKLGSYHASPGTGG